MAAPTRGREDDGRDLVGSGDPGRTGRGGAGRVRSILGANQGWARLCGYGHMFSPGCEWLQSLCSAHPAWASSLVPSPFLHPPSTPPPRPLSWTLGHLTVSWVSMAFQKSFPRLRWMQRQGDWGPELLECRLQFPSSRSSLSRTFPFCPSSGQGSGGRLSHAWQLPISSASWLALLTCSA